MSKRCLAACHGLALVLALIATSPVRADVYVAFDGDGVPQFASEPRDASYRLLFKDVSRAPAARRAEPPEPVRQALLQAARQHGLDYDLLRAVAHAESGFDPHAVSPKGAVGVMQLMPATASRYGVPGTGAALQANLRDIPTNVLAGSRYLRDLLGRFEGSLELALAAYNAGEGAVQRAGNRVPDYAETRQYVRRILAAYRPAASASATAAAGTRPRGAGQADGPVLWSAADDVAGIQQFEQGFMMRVPARR